MGSGWSLSQAESTDSLSFPDPSAPHSLLVSLQSTLSINCTPQVSLSGFSRELHPRREFLEVPGAWGCLCSVLVQAILLEVSGLFRLHII